MEDLIQAAILLSGIAGQLCMVKRNHQGFYWWILTNVLLIIVSIQQAMFGMLALYVFYTVMCFISIRNWRKLDRAASQPESNTSALQPSGQCADRLALPSA